MSDKNITTEFIFVFDDWYSMKLFVQSGQFVKSNYSEYAQCFIEILPKVYDPVDYKVFLDRMFHEYFKNPEGAFKIGELTVNPEIIGGVKEVVVKIKRKKVIPTQFILLIDSSYDRKVFYDSHINDDLLISRALLTDDHNPENPNDLAFVVFLPEDYNSLDYGSFIRKTFSKYLTEFNFRIKDFDYGKNRIIKVKVERKKEMKNMFYDNLSEPVFVDYEPIKGYIHAAPEVTLDNFHLETSDSTPPCVSMIFNISPGIITEDTKFAIKRYLDDSVYARVPRTSYRYPFKETLNGAYKKKTPLTFKLYSGVERTSQRYKTICVWEDGERTTIYCDKPVNGGPVARAFAWCYVKRTFGTVSHFKKHVDKRTTKIGGVIYFEGDCIQDDYAQASVGQDWILYDIYDAAALAITAKRYGGLKKLNDDYIQKALEIDADLREKFEDHVKEVVKDTLKELDEAENSLSKEVLDDTKKKKTKKSNK